MFLLYNEFRKASKHYTAYSLLRENHTTGKTNEKNPILYHINREDDDNNRRKLFEIKVNV